jgi:hypothetical protein
LLGRYVDEKTTGYVLWIAYPVPEHRRGDWRPDFVRPVAAASAGTEEVCEPIDLGDAYAHVYLSRAKQSTIALATQ